jgi:hypothetical protein
LKFDSKAIVVSGALAALVAAWAAAGFAEASFVPKPVVIEYTPFDSHVVAGGDVLPLRGGGMVEYWGFDVYTAAFYAPETKKSLEEVLDGATTRTLIIHYHRAIKSKDFANATNQGLAKNPSLDRSALKERVEKMNQSYRPVQPGDRCKAEFVPQRGTTIVYLNDVEGPEIKGSDFAKAYFGIWIGDYALDADLSRQLLGSK